MRPVDGHAIVMRDPLTRQQAEAVIDDLPNVPELRITDEKARETAYRAVLHGCDCRALAGLIKTLHHRRELRARQGRRPTGLDDRYFRQAEDPALRRARLCAGHRAGGRPAPTSASAWVPAARRMTA